MQNYYGILKKDGSDIEHFKNPFKKTKNAIPANDPRYQTSGTTKGGMTNGYYSSYEKTLKYRLDTALSRLKAANSEQHKAQAAYENAKKRI